MDFYCGQTLEIKLRDPVTLTCKCRKRDVQIKEEVVVIVIIPLITTKMNTM